MFNIVIGNNIKVVFIYLGLVMLSIINYMMSMRYYSKTKNYLWSKFKSNFEIGCYYLAYLIIVIFFFLLWINGVFILSVLFIFNYIIHKLVIINENMDDYCIQNFNGNYSLVKKGKKSIKTYYINFYQTKGHFLFAILFSVCFVLIIFLL